MRALYQDLLYQAYQQYPNTTRYFTIVQHDDGVMFELPPDTIVFGACSGTIPLPLIYEDTTKQLEESTRASDKPRNIMASFVGTYSTHPLRSDMLLALDRKPGVRFSGRDSWSPRVNAQNATNFVDMTLQSMFCLAPRGYGRSSFRFFEAMQLNTIPVYIWNDVEWLPYKEVLDYSTFSVCVHKSELSGLYAKLCSISDEKYKEMLDTLKEVAHFFTLEGMCKYVMGRITRD
jgi:hypothetical protein